MPISPDASGAGYLTSSKTLLNNSKSYPSCWSASSPGADVCCGVAAITGAPENSRWNIHEHGRSACPLRDRAGGCCG